MTRTLQIAVAAFAFIGVACTPGIQQTASPTPGGAGSIAGTYTCAPDPPPEDPDWPGPETFELQGDGTLTITSPPGGGAQGTWTVDGDQVVLHIEGQEDRFAIEGDRLVGAGDPPPGEGTFTCTKEAG